MFSKIFVVLYIIAGCMLLSDAQKGKYKICALEKFREDCDKLERSNSEIACSVMTDWAQCVHKISKGDVSFGVFSAEQTLLFSSFKESDNLYVAGEIRNREYERSIAAYEQIVIASNQYTSNYDFRGKSFYHPGFLSDDVISDYILKAFENKVFSSNNVDKCRYNESTMIEREIAALNDYFGDSCRPGPWTSDVELDKVLKNKYPKLCKLCPYQSCDTSRNPTETTRKEAISSVLSGKAFVAVTSVQALSEYNKTNSISNIKIICDNNRAEASYANNPCTWVRQPWDLIIANRNVEKDLKLFLRETLTEYLYIPPTPYGSGSGPNIAASRAVPVPALASVMQITKENRVLVNVTNDSLKARDYLQQFRPIPAVPTPRRECMKDVRWCVSSDEEKEKCDWLRQAGINQGIYPTISCEKVSKKIECLDHIKDSKSDIAAIDANYGYMAKRKQLQSVAYTEVRNEDLKYTYVFVKQNGNISSVEDLKDRRACFPEYGGLAWFAFVDWVRPQFKRYNICDYGKFTSKLLSSACSPGVRDEDHGKTSDTDEDKLCQLCQPNPESRTEHNCNANLENKFYNNTGAALCLEENIADFIVVEGSMKELREIPQLKNYRALCKSGTLATTNGVEIDKSCALSETIDSEIIMRRNDPREKEYWQLLTDLDKTFVNAQRAPFHLLRTFDGIPDLIFKATAIGFDEANSNNPHINQFVELFNHIDQCSIEGKDGALQYTVSIGLLASFVIALFLAK